MSHDFVVVHHDLDELSQVSYSIKVIPLIEQCVIFVFQAQLLSISRHKSPRSPPIVDSHHLSKTPKAVTKTFLYDKVCIDIVKYKQVTPLGGKQTLLFSLTHPTLG